MIGIGTFLYPDRSPHPDEVTEEYVMIGSVYRLLDCKDDDYMITNIKGDGWWVNKACFDDVYIIVDGDIKVGDSVIRIEGTQGGMDVLDIGTVTGFSANIVETSVTLEEFPRNHLSSRLRKVMCMSTTKYRKPTTHLPAWL
jgi:hypothetical protein